MLEEKHNFKAWLYLSPALVLLLVFTFYPIFNAFNLVFLYNYDYMNRRIDGYTFNHHDPIRAERWAYREHWEGIADLSVTPDGHVYSINSDSYSLHRTDLNGRIAGSQLALDPHKLMTLFDLSAEQDYSQHEITAFYVDGDLRVYMALYDDEDDESIVISNVVRTDGVSGDWTVVDSHEGAAIPGKITAVLGLRLTDLEPGIHSEFYTASEDGVLRRHGTVEWSYTEHTATINAIARDAEGYIYTASDDFDIHKVNGEGNTEWTRTHTSAVKDIAVDTLSLVREEMFVYFVGSDGTLASVTNENVERYTYTYTEGFTTVAATSARNVFVGAEDGTVHRIGLDGELVWSVEAHEEAVTHIAADGRTRTNLYTSSTDGFVRKVSFEGDLIWTSTAHQGSVLATHVDVRNRVYSIGSEGMVFRADTISSESPDQLMVFANFDSKILALTTDRESNIIVALENNSIVKLNAVGEILYAYHHADGHTPIALTSDRDGKIYFTNSDNKVEVLSNTLEHELTIDLSSTALTLAVDRDGAIVVGLLNGEVQKYSSEGQEEWTYTGHTGRINGIDIDRSGNVYTASSDETVRKISSNGNRVWTFSGHDAAVNDVVVDAEGRVYTVSNDETMRRLTEDGDEFWVYTRFSRTNIDSIRINVLALDADDNIYFGTSENFANRGSLVPSVRRVNEATRVSVFHNFTNTVQSDLFIRALINTIIIVFVSVPVSVIISLLLSVWLNSIKKLQGFFQTIFFLPYVTNAIAIGMAFAVIFNRDFGLINYFLTEVFGMSEGLNWLGRVSVDDTASPFRQFLQQYLNLPMLSLLVFITWGGLAFKIMVFLSGLQSIDKQYYDAARVDSTPKSRVFRRITVPLLSPMIAYITITSFIGAFKEYTAIVGMFGINLGPPGDSNRLITIVGLVYRSLDDMNVPGKLSEAAATAIILFFMTLVLTLFNMYISKKRVHY